MKPRQPEIAATGSNVETDADDAPSDLGKIRRQVFRADTHDSRTPLATPLDRSSNMARPSKFTSYRLRRWLAGVGVLAYAVIAIAMKPAGAIEFFPFFNWSLFSSSSDHKTDITLLVTDINGEPVAPPRFFYDMKETFVAARAKDPRLMKLLDRWAYAIWSKDVETADHLRGVVEKTFMSEVSNANYQLVLAVYDPIQRLRAGKIEKIQVIGSFAKEKP